MGKEENSLATLSSWAARWRCCHSGARRRGCGREGDGEGGDRAGEAEQRGGALALLPQRGAASRVAAGEQQRPGGALAEAAGGQRPAADPGGALPLRAVGGA